MNKQKAIQRLKSLRLNLQVYPDTEPNSEFKDRIADLDEVVEWLERDGWIPFDRNVKGILKYKEVLIYEDLSCFNRECRIIQARIHYSEEGRTFGGPNSLTGTGIQKGAYFSVPAILNSNYITHWQPLPEPPKSK